MSITLKTTKILWGRSGNRCAICRSVLVEDAVHDDDDALVLLSVASHVFDVAGADLFTS